MRDTEALLAEVLELSEPARADFVAQILASLDGPPDADVDEAWALEIERRCAAMDSGAAMTTDWSELRQRLERDIFGRE
jgi:putative addiction module component (TIGR02574 family)